MHLNIGPSSTAARFWSWHSATREGRGQCRCRSRQLSDAYTIHDGHFAQIMDCVPTFGAKARFQWFPVSTSGHAVRTGACLRSRRLREPYRNPSPTMGHRLCCCEECCRRRRTRRDHPPGIDDLSRRMACTSVSLSFRAYQWQYQRPCGLEYRPKSVDTLGY